MKEQLDSFGVTVVAISKDSVAVAASHKKRDGLQFPVLSDEKLAVIQLYGVEHHKALEFSKGGFHIFGIPLALLPSVRSMAIPTTLLIDEKGRIQWIDQADDYRLRSNEDRVLSAVQTAFPQPSASQETL